jgi:hypothetical protein
MGRGGGIRLRPLTGHRHCCPMNLKNQSIGGTLDGLRAALRLIDRYPWHRLYALTVHPQFRERVWTAVQLRFAL